MASKSSKKQSAAAGAAATSTTIEFVAPSTPQSSQQSTSSSQHSTPGRPVSPGRISRIQERAELQNLNDRLAAYIERNRQLESENSKLKVHVQKNVEQREIVTIKKMYEAELGDTRNTLDAIAREKAQAELLLSRAQEDLKKFETKYNKKNTEAANLEKKVNSIEAQLEDLRNKINQGNAERKRLEGDIKNLNEENKTLDDKSESLKKQLEEETILRVDLENRNQSLNEELQFQRQLYNKELEEVRIKEYEIKEVYQENVKSQYEQKLNKELTELREENENRLAQYRLELEDKYEAQLSAVHDDLDRKLSDLQNAQSKIKQLNSTYTYMTSEIEQVKKENKSLKDKVADLNKLIEQERDWNQAALNRKDEEIDHLNSRLQVVLDENKDLVDDKIKLDNELATYRKLLETEENRLNISPQVASSPLVSTSSVGSYTPKAFVARGQKRKRICLTEEENLSDLMVTSNAKGDVEISDHDQDGKFVKLNNKGEKEVSLGGWVLTRLADGLETRFKFHRSISIKPGQTVTVWSSDSNAVHHPPSDIVMKAQTWFTAEKMSTTLFNTNSEEMASRNTEKKQSSHSQRFSSHGYSFANETENEEQQKCAIM